MLESLLAFASCIYDQGIVVELRWVPARYRVEGNERVDELVKRLRKSAQSLLAQESPLPILSNVTITTGSLEGLRQALFEHMTQTTHGKQGNINEVKMEAKTEFEKLTDRASPTPCNIPTVSVLN
jgi:hypothetical protein